MATDVKASKRIDHERLVHFVQAAFEKLGVPGDVCKKLCNLPKGLILVTGATGSGKSTTLASMVDFINTPKLTSCYADLTETVRRGGTVRGSGMNEAEMDAWVTFAKSMMPLMKGASGQGVECFNIAFGFDRTTALVGPVQWP